ncbi:bifunctional 2-C-methyl-D-erythritol 4-phosphate cytidylyltransferase/2-C-methyl-D-erythritol 2,4-cyclodiphosphate synthase [Pseudooceanicola marinus]|uniref:bifunctional 2-C-methyl-D-erythritol 4-phosphate cytidylyltransferase/2-C-methyl-D-erythritol 2,4-cyclodiphosphate synthase n=1 Tax=Pseudooceanicola marinus TaxID=396013 RepID=UPI001CD55BDD|nr:bifunctional 2-C-methyl-D-erythritol 4-phosphate cytidylyltransferase/2-C-methyl-D-erythritol 2,4-cyclodiphosphate synthase [Pseudooceanicola marinus]MCA1334473.1 bifunctional 2-C-methyl-D-erythritol 4-phosphate cytidylyltransferase/2-C-methyl-D-erythritol 2,4-cyclodiphosphate synthase [Pseudooceanicola marinus]
MGNAAIIVAAGRGTRAGGHLPKQWQPLAGRRVADWTLDAMIRAGLSPIVVVLHPDDMDLPLPADVVRVAGGATRDASVRAGLAALDPAATANVLIHDVARPCVPGPVIAEVIAALEAGAEAAAPGLPVTDALWHGDAGHVTGTAPRDGLFRAQTPQGFRLQPLLAAHAAHPGGAADDVEVARAAGIRVAITPGSEDNLKITHPGDFDRAEAILRGTMDIRLGNGYDVHAFTEGDHVWLCGVKIPHDAALLGHSDADVGMHAVTDAIYGALAEGDIGRHFPPSDPQWKGAASHIFLEHAVKLAAEKGFAISNVDCTLVCEAPKVGPHAAAMQARMAEIMGLDPARISVKATTSERLGFTGRKEGIASIATACLIKA